MVEARPAGVAVVVMVALAVLGCGGDRSASVNEAAVVEPATTPGAGGATAPAGELLRTVSFADWQALLAAQGDRLVVVELWATWCVPCLERFPHMVELAKRYQPRGVTFLSLSLDDFEDQDSLAHARRFLAESGATFDHYILAESIPRAFDHLGLLGIPAVYLYRGGELVRRLTADDPNNQFTDADVEAAVAELVGTAPPAAG